MLYKPESVMEIDNLVQAKRVAAAYRLCMHREVNEYEEEYTYSTHIDYQSHISQITEAVA